jgi:hypothetical protein
MPTKKPKTSIEESDGPYMVLGEGEFECTAHCGCEMRYREDNCIEYWQCERHAKANLKRGERGAE